MLNVLFIILISFGKQKTHKQILIENKQQSECMLEHRVKDRVIKNYIMLCVMLQPIHAFVRKNFQLLSALPKDVPNVSIPLICVPYSFYKILKLLLFFVFLFQLRNSKEIGRTMLL